jgi:hypothetical protein
MNAQLPAPRSKWPGRLVNLAVVLLVLALAAATFVLSYAGVHAVVLQAGVSAQPARLYPGVFDAVLVIACVAALMLRDARWWARLYAWLVIIAVVAVVGAADAVHAMNVVLSHRTIEGVVAAAPLVLVVLGFSLMLTIFRRPRAQHAGDAASAGRAGEHAAGQAPPLAPAGLPAELAADQPAPTEPGSSTDDAPTAAAAIIPAAEASPAREASPALEEASPAPARTATSQPALTLVTEATPEDSALHTADMPEQPIPAAGQPSAAAEATDGTGVTAGPAEAALAYADSGTVRYGPVAATAGQTVPVARDTSGPTRGSWGSVQQDGHAEPDQQPAASEIDLEAPPYATAPFAALPRLNRIRSTPTPPEDGDE